MRPVLDVKYGFGDYRSDLIDTFEHEVLVEADDDEYQGSSVVLLRDGDRYGVLVFGWGSCSGCDALQACDTVEEATELRDELHRSILWFDLDEARRYITEHDWKGDWLHPATVSQFVAEATAALGVAK